LEADMIITVLVLVTIAAISVPLAAVVLVTAGSRTEEADWTLKGPPPGPVRAAARWIVGFRGDAAGWPGVRISYPPPEWRHREPAAAGRAGSYLGT